MNKPTNNAELIRYLTANPKLECHMPGSKLVVAGNTGNGQFGNPNATIVPRTFVKLSAGCLVMDKGDGKHTRLEVGKAGEIKYFDDRFESASYVTDEPIQYFYK